MHAERANGSCQDLVTMGDGPMYWNRKNNNEFLDKVLWVKVAVNIFQVNMFTIMSSLEMVESSHFFSILHLNICFPCRWLTGHTHKLSHHNWVTISMWQAVNSIHSACKDIVSDMALIHYKSYILHIFDKFHAEITKSRAHLDYEFEGGRSNFVKE